MADTLASPATGSIDSHPDFPEFFRQAREEVLGEFGPRLEQARASGGAAAVERLAAEVDRRARQRAVVATRAMLNFQTGARDASIYGRPFSTLTGVEDRPEARPLVVDAGERPEIALAPPRFTPADMPGSMTAQPYVLPAQEFVPPEEQAPMLPNAWQGLPERREGAPEMIARPLMPQTRQEAEEQMAANERYGTALRVGSALGMAGVPTTSAIGGGLALVRGAGNVLARHPVATAIGTGIASLFGGSSEATPPDPAQQAASERAAIAKLQEQQATLTAERDKLKAEEDAFRERFGNVTSGSPQAQILALQQFLASPQGYSMYSRNERGEPVRPDGVWFGRDGRTSGTQMAVTAYLEYLKAERDKRTASLTDITAQLGSSGQRLSRYEANATTAASEANMPWHQRFVRDYVPPLAALAGGVVGGLWRAGMRRSGDAASRVTAAEADNLLGAPGTATAGTMNQWYTRGGGRPPFDIAPGTQAGFVPSGTSQSAMGLYQPGNPWMRGPDFGRVAGFGAVGAGGAARYYLNDRQAVKEAQDRYDANPTAENAAALRRAQYWAAASQSSMAFGLGAAGTYPAAAAWMRYRSPRPNTAAAENEVMRLNAIAHGRNNQLPPIDARRMRPGPLPGGHWVAPDTPTPAPGAGPAWASPSAQQIWVSQSGQNVVYSTVDGLGRVRWWRRQRSRNGDGPAEPIDGPPRGYRRVASAGEGGDGGTAVG